MLCAKCQSAMPWLDRECCPRCALPAPCGSVCPAGRLAFSAAWAPVEHAGPARALVAALKFRGAVGLADAMGAEMGRRAPDSLLSGATLIAVPADPWRRRYRGLDHALLLTTAVARQRSLPVALALRRSGPAPRQAGRSRRARMVSGRIEVAAVIEPPPVCVLVDDVHTTGATLDACASALIAAGASTVRVMTYARTLPVASGKRMFTTPTF